MALRDKFQGDNKSSTSSNTSKMPDPSDKVVKLTSALVTEPILELGKAARAGKVLGIGLCGLNPSGCFDIANGIGEQFAKVDVIRIQYEIDSFGVTNKLVFLDYPKPNPECETIF